MSAAAKDWFGTDLESVAYILASTVGIYIAVIVLARLRGLRSFSRISAFDVATAVAMGTILATTAMSSSVSLPEGIVAAAGFFAAHTIVSKLRVHRPGKIVDNRPKLLVRDGRLMEKRLHQVGMTTEDLAAKLRHEGIASLHEVAFVVMETTGDVSVIRRDDAGGPKPDDFIMRGIETD